MRESNFAFPAQNRACVCISSQLYDRRALDTNSPLPLSNSLTHLSYLTSTSPRIREIMTMDGGLERLVRILHDFCICPPPPENPTIFYGLSLPTAHPPKLVPTLNPKNYDKQAQYRFSLAFQCVVNIGVRGSEPIRSRVVQAGTLDVVGCILEAWLAGRGFAVGPSVSASGFPRETREQRQARRQAQSEARQREQADALARALQRQVNVERLIRTNRAIADGREGQDDLMETDAPTTDTSTENSSTVTPGGTNTPTGSVVVPGRDRSGTVIGRATWDQATISNRRTHRSRHAIPTGSAIASTSTSADNSRPETETEDDGDIDMDRESSRDGEGSLSGTPPPDRRDSTATVRAPLVHPRRAVGIVSDVATNPDMANDAHIIINDQTVGVEGVGVEDGLVSLEVNDDFAMGAPPGAPGAIEPARVGPDTHGPGERTPRAGTTNLPHVIPIAVPPVPTGGVRVTAADAATVRNARMHAGRGTNIPAPNSVAAPGQAFFRDSDSGPYRDTDVLLSLQLLAYLSKYPHVRQAFYRPRPMFHPATAQLNQGDGRFTQSAAGLSGTASGSRVANATAAAPPATAKEPSSFMKALNNATGRGKEKEKATVAPDTSASLDVGATSTANPPRMTNVFALVERFTFRHSSADLDSPNPPPSLPPEIQYWAGVIMRNACRKDESRGGIRQCANMLCGRWESYPREFAKCRRCRKAKYCGKECQSTAWSEGHRFWCSAKDPEEDDHHHHHGEGSSRSGAGPTATNTPSRTNVAGTGATTATESPGSSATVRGERRGERERDRRLPAPDARLADRAGVARPPAGAMRTALSAMSVDAGETLASLNAPPSPVMANVRGEGSSTSIVYQTGSVEDVSMDDSMMVE